MNHLPIDPVVLATERYYAAQEVPRVCENCEAQDKCDHFGEPEEGLGCRNQLTTEECQDG